MDILKAEDLSSVVVGDGSALHLANLHLHDVLQEAAADQIVELALIALMVTSERVDLIIEVILIVGHVIANRRRRPGF